MSKKKEKLNHKTNAVRIVEAEGIPYKMYTYEAPDGFLDGVSVANSLGQNVDMVFKTLVTVGNSGANYVCVIPVSNELDLKKAARHFSEKKMEMIPAKEITNVTGYMKGGCSPVGMKKQFPTAIDISAESVSSIIVSGGKVGLQMEMGLADLQRVTGADIVDLTSEKVKGEDSLR